ncbi:MULTISPECIES: class I SAM-dependent methyltransferase [Caproicibacterium]|uniref:Class I SAM-dependent methyltransferase n=1 Tax=Caproicibacterium argilliputei TaxID=3030016 RepID=A0AA97D8D9_9FIRM|nr:class I SAM-dependent methyltransferase [Caproicibacterium argilliputei]WOC31584.1 class I SAM-dependent methyltransferase [Caproicibacterium argilliputei]
MEQLETMGAFFDNRLNGYEEHQLNVIDGAKTFYPFTASLLPTTPKCRILDLGCGTGLELNEYFPRNPTASVTGIDLAAGMLERLKEKFSDKALTLIQGSYFTVPFGTAQFDAAVSVESLHHFSQEQKVPLYRKLHAALKDGGFFILTDYMAENDGEEQLHFAELARLRAEQHLPQDTFFHYDTPLTRAHETEALTDAGFSKVEFLRQWSGTVLLKAYK